MTEQHNCRRVAAIVFVLYGLFHSAVIGFVWIVVLALAREGYFDVFRELKTLTLFGITVSVVLLPLLSGYALIRSRPWARGAVRLTCFAILIVSFVMLWQISLPGLSTARLVFGVFYGGANLAFCTYCLWFVSRRERDLSVSNT